MLGGSQNLYVPLYLNIQLLHACSDILSRVISYEISGNQPLISYEITNIATSKTNLKCYSIPYLYASMFKANIFLNNRTKKHFRSH